MKAVFLRRAGQAQGQGGISGDLEEQNVTLYLEPVDDGITALSVDFADGLEVFLTGLDKDQVGELEDLFSSLRYNWPEDPDA